MHKIVHSGPVRIAKPGDVLGLSAALAETACEVTAETLEYTQMKTCRRDDLLQFLKHHMEGSRNAANCLNKEYRAALADASRLALLDSVSGRVAHLLVEFAAEAGTLEDQHPVLHMPLKQADIAAMIGCSRESISRVLQEFRHKGILTIKGATVTNVAGECIPDSILNCTLPAFRLSAIGRKMFSIASGALYVN